MPPDLFFETEIGGIVCGIDEVGRGPLAGPVVACAVILPPRLSRVLLEQVNDSKALSAKRRDALAPLIQAEACYGLGQASVEEIDQINILQATFLAMRRAVEALPQPPESALVDGNRAPVLPCPTRCLVKGDSRSLSIAAASILAKVHRDHLMADLAQTYPGYGWERNAGYGTAEHLAALDRLGVTPHHRRSFAPIATRL